MVWWINREGPPPGRAFLLICYYLVLLKSVRTCGTIPQAESLCKIEVIGVEIAGNRAITHG
jgi:hypothetical protein